MVLSASLVFPSLKSSGQQVPVGATVTLTLKGNPASSQILFQSLRTHPTGAVPPPARFLGGAGPGGADVLGRFVLDRAPLSRIAAVTLSPSGTYNFTLHVPDTPAVLGSTLFLQTVERTANGFEIGNPVLVAVTR